MSTGAPVSLNAIRVFAAVARHGSISLAAGELGVTPSAVSHQVKSLETALGTQLFSRSANALTLTDAGRQLHNDAHPALVLLDKAVSRVRRDVEVLTLQAPTTFATRWLIPALNRFKLRYPDVRIQLETTHSNGMGPSPADITIFYLPARQTTDDGAVIYHDLCTPVLSPNLLNKSGYAQLSDISALPALQVTPDNWDWQHWAAAQSLPDGALNMAEQFDFDDAGLQAAIAGLGMVLAPPLMVQAEMAAGTLIRLPEVEAVELGTYRVRTHPRETLLIRRFRRWLTEELAVVTDPADMHEIA